jgi:excisionase family DNA binding protein
LKILTTKEAGKLLGINDSRVRQLIIEGRLPAIKFGNAWVIQEKDLKKVAIRKPGRPKKGKQKGGK